MVKVKIRKTFNIDAAHSLAGVFPPEHKCARLHGHTYTITVEVRYYSHLDAAAKDLADFGVIKSAIFDKFDHTYLNDSLPAHGYQGVPSAENLAIVFAQCVQVALGDTMCVTRVTVEEGKNNTAIWEDDEKDE